MNSTDKSKILDFVTILEVKRTCRIEFKLAPEIKPLLDDMDVGKMMADDDLFVEACTSIENAYVLDSRDAVLNNREEIMDHYGVVVSWLFYDEEIIDQDPELDRVEEFDPDAEDIYREKMQKIYGK